MAAHCLPGFPSIRYRTSPARHSMISRALGIRVTATDTAGTSTFQYSPSRSPIPMTRPPRRLQLEISRPMRRGFGFSFRRQLFGSGRRRRPDLRRHPGRRQCPAILALASSGTQTFSGTPLNEDVEALDIRVTATDTCRDFGIAGLHRHNCHTNDAPVVARFHTKVVSQRKH